LYESSSKGEIEAWKIRFLALTSNLSDENVTTLFDRLAIPPGSQTKYLQARKEAEDIASTLPPANLLPSQVYDLLNPLSSEGLILSLILNFDKEGGRDRTVELYRSFWKDLEGERAEITGFDLIKLGARPGPIFSEILNQVLLAKLDGQVKSREQEIELAKDLLQKRKYL